VRGGIPGLMVALDEINSDSTILPGYSLHYTLSDTAVSLICECLQVLVDCRTASQATPLHDRATERSS